MCWRLYQPALVGDYEVCIKQHAQRCYVAPSMRVSKLARGNGSSAAINRPSASGIILMFIHLTR